jgi:hypothetical protein
LPLILGLVMIFHAENRACAGVAMNTDHDADRRTCMEGRSGRSCLAADYF